MREGGREREREGGREEREGREGENIFIISFIFSAELSVEESSVSFATTTA